MLPPTEHALVSLARQAILHYLTTGEALKLANEGPMTTARSAGVFVSLKRHGELRGCVGTCVPTQPSLLQEIILNAVSAATVDPRFSPVRLDEMPEMDILVDVLTAPESVAGAEQLDPARFGVIVRSEERVGVLLPDIPQVTTVEQQMAVARRKAGIGPDESVEIYRFEVTRYH